MSDDDEDDDIFGPAEPSESTPETPSSGVLVFLGGVNKFCPRDSAEFAGLRRALAAEIWGRWKKWPWYLERPRMRDIAAGEAIADAMRRHRLTPWTLRRHWRLWLQAYEPGLLALLEDTDDGGSQAWNRLAAEIRGTPLQASKALNSIREHFGFQYGNRVLRAEENAGIITAMPRLRGLGALALDARSPTPALKPSADLENESGEGGGKGKRVKPAPAPGADDEHEVSTLVAAPAEMAAELLRRFSP